MNEAFMNEALRLAVESAGVSGQGPFGAVVARDGEIIGRGVNRVVASHDPTAHAEMEAIREAGKVLKDFRLRGCEIYASCEPCPMCWGAIYWARLDGLFFAATREDAAAAGFDDALLHRELALEAARRRLPGRRIMSGQSLEPFRIWSAHPQRVQY